MKYWKQFPVTTRIYLMVSAYLLVLLGVLTFIRLADLPIGNRIAQALLATDIPKSTPTHQGNTAVDQAGTPLPPGAPWLKAITRAAVRTGPGVTFDAPAMLDTGQVVPVIGTSPDHQWWSIQAPGYAGNKGWVAASEVMVENATGVPVEKVQVTGVVPTEQMPVAQALTVVNIRSKPDINSGVIGTLDNGQEAQIVGKSEDGTWFAIQMPQAKDRQGWVKRDFVSARNVENIPVQQQVEAAAGTGGGPIDPNKPYLTATWQVNVRAGPGREYAIVGSLNQGMAAEVIGKSSDGQWWAITWNTSENGKGWVSAEFVSVTNGDKAQVLK